MLTLRLKAVSAWRGPRYPVRGSGGPADECGVAVRHRIRRTRRRICRSTTCARSASEQRSTIRSSRGRACPTADRLVEIARVAAHVTRADCAVITVADASALPGGVASHCADAGRGAGTVGRIAEQRAAARHGGARRRDGAAGPAAGPATGRARRRLAARGSHRAARSPRRGAVRVRPGRPGAAGRGRRAGGGGAGHGRRQHHRAGADRGRERAPQPVGARGLAARPRTRGRAARLTAASRRRVPPRARGGRHRRDALPGAGRRHPRRRGRRRAGRPGLGGQGRPGGGHPARRCADARGGLRRRPTAGHGLLPVSDGRSEPWRA